MLLVVDVHSGVPVYRQIMDQIKVHIASGLLSTGAELPSTRNLSSDLGVNPMTVSKAYSLLERDGVLERRPGRPLVVREQPEAQVEARRLEPLREALHPCATLAHQLGVPAEEAVTLYREELQNTAIPPSPKSPSAKNSARSRDSEEAS
ncbi:MAG: GntR family transcriptional regulator [Acidobacteriota bacterium]